MDVTVGAPLPDLPGLVHGIVGREPWVIQCDGCGTLEQVSALVLSRIRFNMLMYSRDPRRLCHECAKTAGWDAA